MKPRPFDVRISTSATGDGQTGDESVSKVIEKMPGRALSDFGGGINPTDRATEFTWNYAEIQTPRMDQRQLASYEDPVSAERPVSVVNSAIDGPGLNNLLGRHQEAGRPHAART